MAHLPTVPSCLLLLVLVPASGWCAAPPDRRREKLRRELLQRAGEDQKARKRFLALGGLAPEDSLEELNQITKELREIDRDNTARMKEVVARFGWPGKPLVGADGAQAAWLLVQHADLDPAFQKRCLPLLEKAVRAGDADPKHLAYLTDRVCVAAKKKQKYGTQFRLDNGKWEPFPIEDEANVDRRRKEVGLGPLAEYRKLIEKNSTRKKGR